MKQSGMDEYLGFVPNDKKRLIKIKL